MMPVSLSKYLREKRVSVAMTQQQAGKMLGYEKSQFLSNLERGTSKPPLEVLKRMCEVYKISREEMRARYVEDVVREAESKALQRWSTQVEAQGDPEGTPGS